MFVALLCVYFCLSLLVLSFILIDYFFLSYAFAHFIVVIIVIGIFYSPNWLLILIFSETEKLREKM